MSIATPLKFAQNLVAEHACLDDTVIDATVGNGKDTLFLSQIVGAQGKVYGFDIQEIALRGAAEFLAEHVDEGTIKLFHESHADMLHHIPQEEHGHVAAIMFNLGYLPGGDHSLITEAHSTLPALDASLQLLKKDGLLTIMIYSGHPGGQQEADQVTAWANELPQRSYQVLLYQFINQANNPPFLIAIRKR